MVLTLFSHLMFTFNAPVDVDIVSAMPVGSAGTIRFYIDHQRWQQRGSHESLDWPILIQDVPVNPDGSIIASSPANVPVFEQARSRQPDYSVPLTGRTEYQDSLTGAAHVAGENFGRPGEVQRCIGCHAGHSMIPLPPNLEDAVWTNLAPGATLTVSSRNSNLPNNNGLIDRRVNFRLPYNNYLKFWESQDGLNPTDQWVELTFPVPVTVRTIRLYNIPNSGIQVLATTVRLFSDEGATQQVASNTSGVISNTGTDVHFDDVRARVVRIEFNGVYGSTAGLAEVEVIARGEAGP